MTVTEEHYSIRTCCISLALAIRNKDLQTIARCIAQDWNCVNTCYSHSNQAPEAALFHAIDSGESSILRLLLLCQNTATQITSNRYKLGPLEYAEKFSNNYAVISLLWQTLDYSTKKEKSYVQTKYGLNLPSKAKNKTNPLINSHVFVLTNHHSIFSPKRQPIRLTQRQFVMLSEQIALSQPSPVELDTLVQDAYNACSFDKNTQGNHSLL